MARMNPAHQHGPFPRTRQGVRRELARIGPPSASEPDTITRWRQALERSLAPKRATEPLSESPARRRRELERLGPWVKGEPQTVSRRRAALERSLTPEAFPPTTTPPTSLQEARAETERLGTYVRGEGYHKTMRRAQLRLFITHREWLARRALELQADSGTSPETESIIPGS